MASKIKVDQIEGSTGSTVTIPTGQTLTVTDGLAIGSLPTVTVAKGGTNLTSFTAGDVLYATGATTLAKLPKGTTLQQLRMNSGATAPEWATVAGGGVKQVVFAQTSTRFTTSSTSYVATPITVTITPSSTSNKIMLFMRALVNQTGDTYPRYKWERAISGGATSYINAEPASPNGGSSLGCYLQDRADNSNVDQLNVMSDFYQDSPNTTSACVYTLHGVCENAGQFYINTSSHYEGGGTADYDHVGVTNIMAWEMTV